MLRIIWCIITGKYSTPLQATLEGVINWREGGEGSKHLNQFWLRHIVPKKFLIAGHFRSAGSLPPFPHAPYAYVRSANPRFISVLDSLLHSFHDRKDDLLFSLPPSPFHSSRGIV